MGSVSTLVTIVAPDDPPGDVELPAVECGDLHEEDDREEQSQTRKRRGRTRRRLHALQVPGRSTSREEWGELELIEEDGDAEVVNGRFLRALIGELEDLTEETTTSDREIQKEQRLILEGGAESRGIFLQTHPYSLAEVRRNQQEWIPSMKGSTRP